MNQSSHYFLPPVSYWLSIFKVKTTNLSDDDEDDDNNYANDDHEDTNFYQ